MSSRVYSYLLIFITETHTHKNTCMISTQEELGQSGTRTCLGGDDKRLLQPFTGMTWRAFFDGYCSTVQGLLDWFEVDLGFTWAFIYSNRFVCSVCFLFSSDSHMKSGSTAPVFRWAAATDPHTHMYCMHLLLIDSVRGVGLGSSTIFKKFNEPYAPS